MVDPEFEGFAEMLGSWLKLREKTGLLGMVTLKALQQRREYFKSMGATSTDQVAPNQDYSYRSFEQNVSGFYQGSLWKLSVEETDQFRGQMMTEMVRMSLDDDLVVQLHPGSFRNHNQPLFERFGRDKGAGYSNGNRLCQWPETTTK